MPLPHYRGPMSYYNTDVIYRTLYEIHLYHNHKELLIDSATKIFFDDNEFKLTFSVNPHDAGHLHIYQELLNHLREEELILEIVKFSKTGDIFQKDYLYGVRINNISAMIQEATDDIFDVDVVFYYLHKESIIEDAKPFEPDPEVIF
jgi:hypothetical protein